MSFGSPRQAQVVTPPSASIPVNAQTATQSAKQLMDDPIATIFARRRRDRASTVVASAAQEPTRRTVLGV